MSSGRLDKRLLDKFRETCTYMHVYRELDIYVHAESCMCSLHVNHTQLHGNEDCGHYIYQLCSDGCHSWRAHLQMSVAV